MTAKLITAAAFFLQAVACVLIAFGVAMVALNEWRTGMVLIGAAIAIVVLSVWVGGSVMEIGHE